MRGPPFFRKSSVFREQFAVKQILKPLAPGGAQGIDACARSYAKQKGLAITEIFPCYARYSRAAPLRRNEEIVRRADMVLAFWDGESKGTAYTIRYAQKQGKPLTVHRLQPQEEHPRATD